MTRPRPFECVWDGQTLTPASPYQHRLAFEQFGAGELVTVAREEARSEASHNHEFAWLREAWRSLPESFAMEPWAQSPEHLRKYALCRSGFCTTETVAAGSNAAALRIASFIRGREEYTLVSVQGSTVHVFTPESQAKKAMGKDRFQASKTAIMEFIADLLGCSVDQLPKQEAA